MNFAIGLVITVGCILGGYAALGGHLEVLFQPYEFVIIAGSSLGIFIVANAASTIKDCGKAFVEAVLDRAPKPRDFLDVLSALHALMRELRAKSRSEVETHFDNPQESEIFKNFPKLLTNKDLGRSDDLRNGDSQRRANQIQRCILEVGGGLRRASG